MSAIPAKKIERRNFYATAWLWTHSALGTKPFPKRFARKSSTGFRGSISSRISQRHSFTASNTRPNRRKVPATKTSARISSATTSGAISTIRSRIHRSKTLSVRPKCQSASKNCMPNNTSSTKHLGCMSQRPARFPSSSSHSTAPIVI